MPLIFNRFVRRHLLFSSVSLPPPAKSSPGRRAFWLCFISACMVAGYLVCAFATLALGATEGNIVSKLLRSVFFDPMAQYAVGTCILGLFVWGLLGVARVWNDPLARMHGFLSLPPLLFMLAVACLVFSDFAWLQSGSEKIPNDVLQALHSPVHVILYSIDPAPYQVIEDLKQKQPASGAPLAKLQAFHDFHILGGVNLDGPRASAAAGAFQSAFAPPSRKKEMYSCFRPRHGLRVESGGHEYDFLLCYECKSIEVFRDGQGIYGDSVIGSPEVLNALLAEAKIPLAR